jgi:hypothetical protein
MAKVNKIEFTKQVNDEDIESLKKDPKFKKIMEETEDDSFKDKGQVHKTLKKVKEDSEDDFPDFASIFEEEEDKSSNINKEQKNNSKEKVKIDSNFVEERLFGRNEKNDTEKSNSSINENISKISNNTKEPLNKKYSEDIKQDSNSENKEKNVRREFIPLEKSEKKETPNKFSFINEDNENPTEDNEDEEFEEDEEIEEEEDSEEEYEEEEEDEENEDDEENDSSEEGTVEGSSIDLNLQNNKDVNSLLGDFENKVEEEAPKKGSTSDSKMQSFASSLKKSRKSFWDSEKGEAKDALIDFEKKKDIKPKEDPTFEKNEKTDKDSSKYLSFKKEEKIKVNENSIHFSLSTLFDKMKTLGFNKIEAKVLLETLEINSINKFASIFACLELKPLTKLVIENYRNILYDLQNGLESSFITEFFKNKSTLLNNVTFVKLSSPIKLLNINCGLIDSVYSNKINIVTLSQFILKSKRQHIFKGFLIGGETVTGLALALNKVIKGGSVALNIYTKLGFTSYNKEIAYLFLAKDNLNNDFVLLIK